MFKFWSAEFVTNLLTTRAQVSYSSTKQDIAIIGTTVNEEGTDAMSEQTTFQFGLKEQHMLICEVYRYMMVGAAMMVCLAHGANDVANSISPLLTVFSSH